MGRQQQRYEPIIVDIPAAGDKVPWWGAPLGIAVAILAIAVAWALWQMAQAVSWSILLMGAGVSARQTLVGLAYWRAAELAGRARIEAAQGEADAARIDAQSRRLLAAGQTRQLKGGKL